MRALAGVIVLLVLLWLQSRGPVFAFNDGALQLYTDTGGTRAVEASVAARKSFGGTAPERVREQVGHWKEQLK